MEIPVHLRHDAAHYDLCGESGVCGGGRQRKHAGCKGRHRGRGDSGIHPVCEELHPAHHSGGAGIQYVPVHGCGGGEGVRVSGGRGGGRHRVRGSGNRKDPRGSLFRPCTFRLSVG